MNSEIWRVIGVAVVVLLVFFGKPLGRRYDRLADEDIRKRERGTWRFLDEPPIKK